MKENLEIIYVTFPTLDNAELVAKHLLQLNFIACANIIFSKSMYNWNGVLNMVDEYVMILKTTANFVDVSIEAVKSMHVYETPAIFSVAVNNVSDSYLDWVTQSVKSESN